ncbi:pilus assembly protein CpaE [Salana multivorans]
MISPDLARLLAAAGLTWTPRSGDVFTIPGATPGAEGLDPDAEHYVVSELTIEPRRYPTGTILAFNGTTEWALDSVQAEDALWLPREDQLREALGEGFIALRRSDLGYVVEDDDGAHHPAASAADALGEALLARLRRPA